VQKRFFDILRGEQADVHGWLTPTSAEATVGRPATAAAGVR